MFHYLFTNFVGNFKRPFKPALVLMHVSEMNRIFISITDYNKDSDIRVISK